MSYPEAMNFDLNSVRFKADPWTECERMRNCGPLVCTKLPFIGKCWVTTNHEASNDMLRNQKLFVREPKNAGLSDRAVIKWWMPRLVKSMLTSMIARDEPDHRRLRSLVEKAFLKQNVESLRERIREIAHRKMDQLERALDRNQRVDMIEHFARPLPFTVICEMLGVPREDWEMLNRILAPFSSVNSVWKAMFALARIKKVLKYFERQFEICRKQPREGLISDLVHAEQEGDRLSQEELLSMVLLLFLAGHETTVHLIANGVLTLLQHEDQKAQFLRDESLMETAIEEIHRFATPVQMTKPRYVSEDIEFHGQSLSKGQMIVAFLAAANSDPAKFDRPREFDITRSPNPHIGFGVGVHVCLGIKLARVETQIALREFFVRFPSSRLALPPESLAWNTRIGMRALKKLEVHLGDEAV